MVESTHETEDRPAMAIGGESLHEKGKSMCAKIIAPIPIPADSGPSSPGDVDSVDWHSPTAEVKHTCKNTDEEIEKSLAGDTNTELKDAESNVCDNNQINSVMKVSLNTSNESSQPSNADHVSSNLSHDNRSAAETKPEQKSLTKGVEETSIDEQVSTESKDKAKDAAIEGEETPVEDHVSIEGTVNVKGDKFTMQGNWLFNGSSMGKITYVSGPEDVQIVLGTDETAGEPIQSAFKAGVENTIPNSGFSSTEETLSGASDSLKEKELRRWTGSFTMFNPAFEVRRKKRRNARRHLVVVEKFDWKIDAQSKDKTNPNMLAFNGIGANRFGKFSLHGTLNTSTGAFLADKVYLNTEPLSGSEEDESLIAQTSEEARPRSRKSGRAFVYSDDIKGTRSSKRQRMPNKVLKLDTTKQNYAFIARHGNGSALSPSMRAAVTKSSRQSGTALTIKDQQRQGKALEGLLKGTPDMRDIHNVFRKPLDRGWANHLRRVAKRKVNTLVRNMLRQPAGSNKRSPSVSGRSASDSIGNHYEVGGKRIKERGYAKGGRGRSRSRLEHSQSFVIEDQHVEEEGPLVASQLYAGGLVDGMRHGLGVCTFENGRVYEGEWKFGQMNGRGRILSHKGQVLYQGEFVDGSMNGKGTHLFSNGDRYDGEFKDNCFHGFGVFYEASSASTYQGDWVRGTRSGHGLLTMKDGSFYSGEWHGGAMSGRGSMMLKDRCLYEGAFKDNQFDGRGLCKYTSPEDPDQGSFEGNFRMGVKEGRGTYSFPNGAVYEGRFRNDRHEGFGVLEMTRDDSIKVGNDDWIVPVNLQSDLRFMHRAAGFNDDGN